MRTNASSRKVLLAVSLGFLAGCGGDPTGRQAVWGTVYFQGQPLDQGGIHFSPIDKGASEAGAGIENGVYRIRREQGLLPGTYKVAVSSYDRKGAKVASDEIPGEPSAKQFRERIPAKYNNKTTLTAEVTGKGPNIFDFKLD